MFRRQYLVLGVGTLPGLAGCGGSERDGSSSPTPTETATPTATPEPATFELERIRAPETSETGREVTYTVAVTNTGDQPGTFESDVRTKLGNAEWDTTGSLAREIGPGETVELSTTYASRYVATLELELTAFDERVSTRFTPARLDWGEPFTIPDRYELTAAGVRFVDSYEVWTESAEEPTTVRPDEGMKFAWVQFRAENISITDQSVPERSEITLLARGSEYDYRVSSLYANTYEGGRIRSNDMRQGEILYQVPDDLARDEVAVSHSKSAYVGDVSMTWGETD